ncbi:MAG: hypothetical protein SAL07_25250 [Oscillatoria sp. PMC 1051.18]|nr:hypothetical protein [Oscillatoria sp. PMC 1050.18]MEC5033214.1 hypothetical protein [Oscillatoria sp. PMC 1051.18]
MADIHLIDGEKGGVGKSLFCRTLLHYWLTNDGLKQKPVLFDTDPSRKDVENFYKSQLKCGDAHFSEDNEKLVAADSIFQTALFGEPVVVNLGAGVYQVISDWIRLNGLIELGEMAGDSQAMKSSPVFQAFFDSAQSDESDNTLDGEDKSADNDSDSRQLSKVRFFKWFVSSGQTDSIEPFRQSLREFGNDIPHIFVKNHYLYDDDQWDTIMSDLQSELSNYNVKVISLGRLLKVDLKQILDNLLTFEQAVEDSELQLMQRQRIYMFCNQAISEIDSVFNELINNGNKGKKGKKAA